MHALSFNLHLAFKVGVNPGDDFHRGGFTSTVLPHKAVDFASQQGEVNVLQGRNATKGL